jgi:hypothetical protein
MIIQINKHSFLHLLKEKLVLRSSRLNSNLFQTNSAQVFSRFSYYYILESGTERTHLSSAEKLPIFDDPHPTPNPTSKFL